MTGRASEHRLFEHLRFVVIDEIHALAADDRGTHLLAVVERLARLTEGYGVYMLPQASRPLVVSAVVDHIAHLVACTVLETQFPRRRHEPLSESGPKDQRL